MLTFGRIFQVRVLMLLIITLTGTTSSMKIYYEGNTCPLSPGKFGVCTKITECKSIDSGLKSKRISVSSLVQCAFSGSSLVVCCPDRVPQPQISTTKRPRGDGGIIFIEEVTETNTNHKTNQTDELKTTTRQPKVLINIKNITITDQVEYIDLTKLLEHRQKLLESSTIASNLSLPQLASHKQSSSSSASSAANLGTSKHSFNSTLKSSNSLKFNSFDPRPNSISFNNNESKIFRFNDSPNEQQNIEYSTKLPIHDQQNSSQNQQNADDLNRDDENRFDFQTVDNYTSATSNASISILSPEDDPWFPFQFRSSTPVPIPILIPIFNPLPLAPKDIHVKSEPIKNQNSPQHHSASSSDRIVWRSISSSTNIPIKKPKYLTFFPSGESGEYIKEWGEQDSRIVWESITTTTKQPQISNNQLNKNTNTNHISTTVSNIRNGNWIWSKESVTKPTIRSSSDKSRVVFPSSTTIISHNHHNHKNTTLQISDNQITNHNTRPKFMLTTSTSVPPIPARTSTTVSSSANRLPISGSQSDSNDDDSEPISINRGNIRKCETACVQFTKRLSPDIDFHIVGGERTHRGEFPHMVGMGYRAFETEDYSWDCGGSLISERYVLTAAHCSDNPNRQPKIVRLGKRTIRNNDDGEEALDVKINRIILHPDYRSSSKYDDIALIQLENDVEFSQIVSPACLYTNVADLDRTTQVVATGWGTDDVAKRTQSNFMLKVNLTVIDLISCNQSYFEYGFSRQYGSGLKMGQICAFDPEMDKDSCQGDSGGPLQLVNDTVHLSTIVGITSFGIGCASAIPSVYTRVSFYLDWIESIVWP